MVEMLEGPADEAGCLIDSAPRSSLSWSSPSWSSPSWSSSRSSSSSPWSSLSWSSSSWSSSSSLSPSFDGPADGFGYPIDSPPRSSFGQIMKIEGHGTYYKTIIQQL